MTNVVISSAARTAVGSYGKSLKEVPPTELGRIAAVAALERARTAPEDVETVVFGNVIHSEAKDMYMARVVGVNAGIPTDTPAYTVNRLCGTGVQAIVSATQAIQTGEARVALKIPGRGDVPRPTPAPASISLDWGLTGSDAAAQAPLGKKSDPAAAAATAGASSGAAAGQ